MVITLDPALGWTIFGCVLVVCITIDSVVKSVTSKQEIIYPDFENPPTMQPLQIGLDPQAINHHISKEIKNFGRYGNGGDVDSSYSQGRIDSYKDIRCHVELGKFNHK